MSSTINVPSAGAFVTHEHVRQIAQAAADDIGALQTADAAVQRGTLAITSGTGTVSAGVTITSSSRIVVTLKGRPTGSTDFAGHAVTDRTVGAPGVGAFTVEFIVAAGTIDADAAGAVDWVVYD